LLARPSLSLSLDRDPESPRPSARRRWRCTSIAAGTTYIGKLEAEGVIQRQGDGFPLDRSRVANWLCHRFPKTMYVILFIVNVLLSGRRRR
jgi:hypothetical protein